ncbi:MAG: hypothetical protein V1779_03270 [bacterium]
MNTYSEYIKITSDKLIINFPSGFYKGRALIEITPLPEETTEISTDKSKRENFRKLLLQRPSCLSQDEIKKFNTISKWINEWKTEVS